MIGGEGIGEGQLWCIWGVESGDSGILFGATQMPHCVR